MEETPVCRKCGTRLPEDAPAGLCPKCLVLAGFESQSAADPKLLPTQASPPPSASSGFIPPTAEELATRFPQLEILELLGRGGMGAVYKARQRELDRLVAVKILPPEVSADPAFAERFTREARALARLSHPNIVAVYDFGRTSAVPTPTGRGTQRVPGGEGAAGEGVQAEGQLFYFIMEYVDGVNLRQAIQSGGMSPKEALAIVPQICDALQFAHDEGIVHRDVKPENLLLDKRGRVKIADFGLAKLLGQAPGDVSLTATQQVMGTLRYMAPEQLEGTKAVDHRADIYSLGVVFYELLTDELPIGRFAPPSKKVEIDVRLDEVVLRALEKEPEQRYQHVSEVRTAVENVTSHPAGAMPPATTGIATDQALITATTLRTFTTADPTITKDVVVDGATWLAVGTKAQTYRLFEVPQPGVEDCTVTYRAKLKTEGLTGRAYLEMWCRLPGRGEFFSKGLNQIATGSNDWATYEIPFFLKKGEKPDLIRLNLVVEAAGKLSKNVVTGKVWITDVELVQQVSEAKTGGERGAPISRGRARDETASDAPDKGETPQVLAPAVALALVGGYAGLSGAARFIEGLARTIASQSADEDPARLLIAAGAGVTALVGAVQMTRLRSYGLAIAGSIAAMVAGAAMLRPEFIAAGLAVGIWALATLLNPQVQATFGLKVEPDALAAAKEPRRQVKGAAVALVVGGITHCVCGTGFLWTALSQRTSSWQSFLTGGEGVLGIAEWVLGLILIAGAVTTATLRAYRFSIGAALFAILPLPLGCFVSLPLGIWALIVLRRSEVKASFGAGRTQRERERGDWRTSEGPQSPTAAPDPTALLRGPAIALLVTGFLGLLPKSAFHVILYLHGSFPVPDGHWSLTLRSILIVFEDPTFLVGVFLLVTAVVLLWRQGYGLAVVAGVVAMLPISATFIVGLPVGIWMLATLSRPDVRLAFAELRGPIDPRAARRVRGPALPLLIAAASSVLLFYVVFVFLPSKDRDWAFAIYESPTLLIVWEYRAWLAIPTLLFGILAIVGAAKMLTLRSYPLAMTGAVIAVLPVWPGFVLTLPFGIWALWALARPEVKAGFGTAGSWHEGEPGADQQDSAGWETSATATDPGARLHGPAIGLIAAAILNWLAPFAFLTITAHELGRFGNWPPEQQAFVAAVLGGIFLAGLAVGGLLVFASLAMRRQESYGLAITGTIVAILVPPGCVIGLPCGLWALLALNRPDVTAAFAATDAARPGASSLRRAMRIGLAVLAWLAAGVVTAGAVLFILGTWVPARYSVTDVCFLESVPVNVPIDSSASYSLRSYPLDCVATGEGRTCGRNPSNSKLEKQCLTLYCRTPIVATLPVVGEMQIDLRTLGYKYRGRDDVEVAAEEGLDARAIQDWLKACGAGAVHPSLAAEVASRVGPDGPRARAEAANLAEAARNWNSRMTEELFDRTLFTPSGSQLTRSVVPVPWVEPAAWIGLAVLWLACGVFLLRALRRPWTTSSLAVN